MIAEIRGGRRDAVRRRVFFAGIGDAWPVAAMFFAMYVALGAAGREIGFGLAQGLVMTVSMFAVPAQVAAIDMIANGASLTVIATVAIINARFFLMSTSLVPRFGRVGLPPMLAGLTMVTASTFIVSYARIGNRRELFPFAYFLGVGLCSLSAAVFGLITGHVLVADLPPNMDRLLAMLLPVYFVTFLARAWPRFRFVLAGGCGALATPVIDIMVPGMGLIGAGLAVAAVFFLADHLSVQSTGRSS